MLLGITHKSNEMAFSLISFLETKGNIRSCSETQIAQNDYLNIAVEFGTSANVYIINTPQAIINLSNPEHVQEILNINGVRFKDSTDDLTVKTYKILVFERTALAIKLRVNSRPSGKSKYIEEDQCKKIAEAAKRAVYLLGLDYGLVEIAVTMSKKIHIVSIEDSPCLDEKEAHALLDKLEKVMDTADKIGLREVKLGADPEFMLSNARNGQMIPASQFFPREGTVGCDSIRMPNRQHRPVAELRPQPDYSPMQLLSNLDKALRSANKMVPYKNIKWLAGSRPFNGYSIGGHIHFSNVDINNHILRALDNYVALPLFLIENQATAVKRRNKYGFLADYRDKEYGGFEYRTPGSWLVSPEIAAATLCLGKITASNYLRLTRNCFLSHEAQRAFYEGDQEYLRIIFNDIWGDIKKIDMYDEYKDELQIIYDMVKNNIKWPEKEDIRKTWSLSIITRKKNLISTPENDVLQSTDSLQSNSFNGLNEIRYTGNRDPRGRRHNRQHISGPVFTSTQHFNN